MLKVNFIFAAIASSLVAAIPVSVQNNLIIFGNSLSDNGNVAALTGSPGYWEGRASNSYVWNEYTTKLLGMNLENHAYGGATSNNDLSPATSGNITIPSFHDQVTTWLKDPAHLSQHSLQNDVVAVEIGGNDIFHNVPNILNGSITLNDFAKALGKSIADDVNALVKAGYKNVYVWNLPAVDKIPYITSIGMGSLVKPLVDEINNRIDIALQPAVALGVHKLNLMDLMNQALVPQVLAAMGITDSTHACYNKDSAGAVTICQDPDNHFFYDGVHPASRMQYLWGIAASILIRDPGHKFSTEEILGLIKTFDIANSNNKNNLIVDGVTGPESSAIPSGSVTPTGSATPTAAPTDTVYPTVAPTSTAPPKCIKKH
ncbi:hypothetical protein EC988_001126 [Linderina pennispora]|nr:hypothetical protein EC988_001126 [Linderina pennispora]